MNTWETFFEYNGLTANLRHVGCRMFLINAGYIEPHEITRGLGCLLRGSLYFTSINRRLTNDVHELLHSKVIWMYTGDRCCVEAECHSYYLRDSSVYVHESCLLGYQRHPLTYVGLRRFWYGPLTKYGS